MGFEFSPVLRPLRCRSFTANAVRLQLHALAYNLGNFLRTLATQEPIKDWSLTSLKEKLIQDRRKGRKPRQLCRLPDGRGRHPTANVPGDFAPDRGTTTATATSASMKRSIAIHSTATDGTSTSKCQRRLATRPPFWIPEVSVAVRSSRPSCSKAEKREYSWQIGSHPGNPG